MSFKVETIKKGLSMDLVKICLILMVALMQMPAWALGPEAVVIEVRKKVKLHPMERVYADYFIRGGSTLGLEKGTIVSVVRRVPVHDPFENASVGDFRIKVADIEIIQSDEKKSVGRLIEIDRREARPMLTYDSVMIGDRLDLESLRTKTANYEAPESVFSKARVPATEKAKPAPPVDQQPLSMENQQMQEPLLTKPIR
ncbi:MAG: hypothetical protein KDD33_05855 [Bdellovibrionales bacterium]|nr:hypothetical protein [Bdellovibrionales bacterium]